MKFLMEFIQELRKENRQLTKELEEIQEKLQQFKLEETQDSKVFFFIFVYFILLQIDFMLFLSIWT